MTAQMGRAMVTLQKQLAVMPKYYHSHLWVTAPASDGLSFMGLSEWAKRYFVRIKGVNLEAYPKSNYGISNSEYLQAYIRENRERRERGELTLAERMEWGRFHIQKGEGFAMLEAVEFDVELEAPADMMLTEVEWELSYGGQTLWVPYYFRGLLLDPAQLSGLKDQKQYDESVKMIKY